MITYQGVSLWPYWYTHFLFGFIFVCLFFAEESSSDQYPKFYFFNHFLLPCFLSQTTDDWQRNLAAMVANPPRQHPKCIKKNMTCLGDTLCKFSFEWGIFSDFQWGVIIITLKWNAKPQLERSNQWTICKKMKDLISEEISVPCWWASGKWKCEKCESENVVSNELIRVEWLLWKDSEDEVSNTSFSLNQLMKVQC